ncbi:C50 carotenoid gamma-cyclase subunit alpha CrtYg [Micrococcus luteus]|uniref:C50 carotenoid gamma-cyclase subunit alpha CrtYg n=1 Tax=Micrococcus luteus TaxID=1270 RepID=UPI003F815180
MGADRGGGGMIYLLALLGVIGCMLLVDRRFELFLWHRPLPALLVLAAGVAYFVAWDLWGIAEGVFLHRQSPYMTGVMLAPQLPLEEGFFLLFLSQITMVLFTGALRLLRGRGRDGRAATPADPTDGGSR